jgi:hypothetical protein
MCAHALKIILLFLLWLLGFFKIQLLYQNCTAEIPPIPSNHLPKYHGMETWLTLQLQKFDFITSVCWPTQTPGWLPFSHKGLVTSCSLMIKSRAPALARFVLIQALLLPACVIFRNYCWLAKWSFFICTMETIIIPTLQDFVKFYSIKIH